MKTRLSCCAVLLGMALLSGCYQDVEKDGNYAILKAGAAVPSAMDGWVGVPATKPVEAKDEASGVTYYRLVGHSVVPNHLNGCYALAPATFARLSGIKVEALPGDVPELLNMKRDKKIPAESNGWYGIPLSYPKIEKDGEQSAAILGGWQVVPKDMHGWVAVDRESMAKLAESAEMKMGTLSDKQPKGEPKK
ncbi:MAG: hypothetical protein HS116_20080 [Planctomycetes bacterium]|nr:hypothetical protein [Planctomycetota bacterium]